MRLFRGRRSRLYNVFVNESGLSGPVTIADSPRFLQPKGMIMRLPILLLAILVTGPAWGSEQRFEAWTAACADAKSGPNCRAVTEAPASGAQSVRLTVSREPAKDAPPRLALTLIGALRAPPRPRLALAIDGGPPVRIASGSDLSTAPGEAPGATDLRLSESATRRLLPFLRRGKALSATVSGEGGDPVSVELSLAGFGPAAAEMDSRQGRAERPDALSALIGGTSAAALSGRLRDVPRDAVPAPLKQAVAERDCPVWDTAEENPSFLAEESFAADLGGERTLWAIVCASGAYNVEYALFTEDPSRAANRFDPLLFASFVESIGWTGVDTLSNVAYDPDKKQLTAFEKGRAAGDCGTVGTWEWVGAAFRMIEYRAKEECDGSGKAENFPIVFRGER